MKMTSEQIKGIIVPILTPMEADESISENGLRAHIERMIQAGVHGIFCLGTNGESFALNYEEKCRVIDLCVHFVDGRVPVYAGTGCVTTRETLQLSAYAQKAGADVLSVITPSFAAVSQDQLIRHYSELAETVDIPFLLYNIPARTGAAIQPATFEKMMDLPNLAGIKDSSGNFDNMLQYLERARNKNLSILSGNDSLILWNLLAGGNGGIAGCANVYPHTLVSIYERFQAGDLASARAAQDSIRSLRSCFQYGNPNTVIKLAVEMSGYPVGACRKPFDGISAAGCEALRQVLADNQKAGMN